MACHAFTQCWIHLIWATKLRAQIVSRDVRRRISRFLSRQAREKEIYMLINYVNADHVHVLIDLPTKRSVADVVRLLKGSSSRWITEQQIIPGDFSWARGYGAFSVSPSNVDRVTRYIAHQEAHHRRTSFQSEYQKLVEAASQKTHSPGIPLEIPLSPTIHHGVKEAKERKSHTLKYARD